MLIWGQSFVKVTYFLEGDGPLVVDCFEIIQTVQAAIQAAHTSNVAVVAQRLTGTGGSLVLQQFIQNAQTCIQTGLDYFERQLATSLKGSLLAF